MLLLEQFKNLTLYPKNAARLKELVLQLAVQGKLTENWRKHNPDVEPASILLKQIKAKKAQIVKEKKIKKEKPLEPVSKEQVPFELPVGWVWCRMEDLAVKLGAGSTPKGGKEVYVDSGIPFLRSQNVYDDGLRLNGVAQITEAVHQKMSGTHVKPKDILLNITGASIGRCALVPDNFETANVSQHVAIIRLVDFGIRKYIHCLLTSTFIQDLIMDVQVGVSREGLSMTKLKDFLIPLPPLAEQDAIVARVEELMHKIAELEQQTKERIQLKKDLGIAALQRLTAAADEDLDQHWHFLKQHFQTLFDEEENVKKLRETILQLAVQGKLTSSWRKHHPNTEPASELLKRIQAEKAQLVKEKKIKKEKPLKPISEDDMPYKLPNGWEWCRFQNIQLEAQAGLERSKDLQSTNYKFGYLKMNNIGLDGSLELNLLVRVDASDEEVARYKLREGDFLFNSRNSKELVGKTAVFSTSLDPYPILYNNNIIRVRFSKQANPNFINFWFASPLAYNLKQSLVTATTNVAALYQGQLMAFMAPFPPLAEQEAIVTKVVQLMQICNELEEQIKKSKQETEALMQALVQEASQVKEEVAI